MKQKLIAIFIVGFFVYLATGDYAAAQKSGTTPVKLKVASIMPPPSLNMKAELLYWWQQEATKRTNGAVTFETFWGASLAAPVEHIEILRKGTVQVAQTDEWYTPGRFPISDFQFIFPFGPSDRMMIIEANRKMRSEFLDWEKDETSQGVKMMVFSPGMEYRFLSRTSIRKLDDFKGQKVTLVGRYMGKFLPSGATAVVRPAGERYELLRTGVVGVDLLPFDLAHSFKIFEQAKNCLITNVMTICYAAVLMNLNSFKELSPEIQKILVETARDAEVYHVKEQVPKWRKKIDDEWKAKGITFFELPQEEQIKWANQLPDIPAEWAAEMEAKGYPAFKMVRRWQEITSELGFKWSRKWGSKK